MKTRGGNAYVGVLGARYVLPVLTETGHADVAFTAATQTDEPSWGYWTDVLGFTSLGEDWPAGTRSRNHHMFGAIVQWMYEDLAGLRPARTGLRRRRVPPGRLRERPRAGGRVVRERARHGRDALAAHGRRVRARRHRAADRDRPRLRSRGERRGRDRDRRRGPPWRRIARRASPCAAPKATASCTRSAPASTSSASRAASSGDKPKAPRTR